MSFTITVTNEQLDAITSLNIKFLKEHITNYIKSNLYKLDDIIRLFEYFRNRFNQHLLENIPRIMNYIKCITFNERSINIIEYIILHYNYDITNMQSYLFDKIQYHTKSNDIIQLIDVLCNSGMNIDNFIEDYNIFAKWNIDIITYIISKAKDKHLFVHKLCSSIQHIDMNNHNKKDYMVFIDDLIEKMIEDYNNINEQDYDGNTALHIINRKYVKYLKMEDIVKISWYEYLISKLILYGAQIDIKNNKQKTALYFNVYEYKNKDKKMYCKLQDCISNVIVNRNDAITIVSSVSNYLDPNIANIVFDHMYTFDSSTHNDLAMNVIDI